MQAWFDYGSGGFCIVCHSDEVDQQDVHHVYTASKVTQAQLLRADRQSFLRLAEMVTSAFKPNAAGALSHVAFASSEGNPQSRQGEGRS